MRTQRPDLAPAGALEAKATRACAHLTSSARHGAGVLGRDQIERAVVAESLKPLRFPLVVTTCRPWAWLGKGCSAAGRSIATYQMLRIVNARL
jgi:hypothetical protein